MMSENLFNTLYLKQKRNIKKEQHSFLSISAMFFCLAIVIVFLLYLNYKQHDFLLPKNLMDYLVGNHYGKEEHSLKFDNALLVASKLFVYDTVFVFYALVFVIVLVNQIGEPCYPIRHIWVCSLLLFYV